MEILDLKTNLLNQNNYTHNQLTSTFVGSLITYPINYIHPKCLPCDGYILKIADYKDLYSVIKDNFNKGTEGADEFRIPDYNITGVFLQPNSVANKSINAGLPNITGYISGDDYKMASIGGAFYYSGTASGQHCETVGGSFNIIQFNASRISTIYGKSATVQPPSKTVQICIRYK